MNPASRNLDRILARLIRLDLRRGLDVRRPRLRAGEVSDREVIDAIRSVPTHYAVQDATGLVAGTSVTWKSSGGTSVITCTSLAAAALRQGDKSGTLINAPSGITTTILPELLEWYVILQFTSAPAAGGEVGLYLGFSDSATAGTNNPGGLGGADATGPNVDVLPQLVFAGSLVASNNLSTGVQGTRLFTRAYEAYVIPVVYNNASVALDATALHTVITMTPWYRERST